MTRLERIQLGRTSYARAYEVQQQTLERVLAQRESSEPLTGVILSVEHDPVITVSRRAGTAQHIIASQGTLAKLGIAVEETDRGGDITYHGPGQLVVYPIIDLNVCNLGLHAYMRLLEDAVIDACASWGIAATRDAAATGVWVPIDPATGQYAPQSNTLAKLCAMGVRVRRWVSMHGLAVNISTNLSHFETIVPCGLHGRPVCSLESLRLPAMPSFEQASTDLIDALATRLHAQAEKTDLERERRLRT